MCVVANITKDEAKGQLAEKVSVTEFTDLPLDMIVLTPHNPRKINPADPAIAELAKSIKESGLLQPVICRPLTAGKYELLAGARRYHACKSLKAETIMAIVRDLDDKSAIEITVLENLQREDLSPLEEARGVNELLTSGHDVAVIADNLGKSKGWVYRRAKLVDLIPALVKKIEDADPENPWLTATAAHLEVIARLPKERQEEIAEENYYGIDDNVQDFAKRLGRGEMLLSEAIWKLDDSTLGDPACANCQKRSDINPELFDDQWLPAKIRKQARCLIPECWAKKFALCTRKQVDELRQLHGDKLIILDNRGYSAQGKDGIKSTCKEYDTEVAKKTDPGARPCVSLSYDGTMHIGYVKLKAGHKEAKAKQPSIELKRKALIIKSVLGALSERKDPPFKTLTEAAAFVAVFGTDKRQDYVGDGKKHWEQITRLKVADEAEQIAVLWKDMKPVLMRRLKFFTVSECKDQYAEALKQADLLGLGSEKELLALAARQMPGKGVTPK